MADTQSMDANVASIGSRPDPRTLPVAALADATDGTAIIDLGLIAGKGRIVGPAYTVSVKTGDNLALHVALTEALAGDVIVASCGEGRFGYWGEIMTVAAMRRGISALVIDGDVRDVAAIRALGFPVFARGHCLRKTRKVEGGVQGVPIDLRGARVAAGDLIVGDAEGLVALPHDRVPQLLVEAARIKDCERWMLAELAAGRSTLELLDAAGRASQDPA